MKNFHHPNNWNYSHENKHYIKVGAYGTDDLEFTVQIDGSVYLPEVDRYYSSLESAYTSENERWIKEEEKEK